MGCALGVAVVALACSAWLSAVGHAPTLRSCFGARFPLPLESAPSTRADRHPLILKMPPFSQTAVRRAMDLALRKLAWPDCPGVYEEFALADGRTPRSQLDRMGMGPEEFLETLVFVDGSWDPVCHVGRVALTTTPGSRVIRVCPGFPEYQLQDPGMSAVLIIHESLHALGLGEDPPSSSEITQRVERRCWNSATGIRKATLPSHGHAGPEAPR